MDFLNYLTAEAFKQKSTTNLIRRTKITHKWELAPRIM